MKILKLPTYCYPEQLSSAHLTQDLESAFQQNGIQKVVYVPTPCRGISPEEREKYKKILYEERTGGAVQIHRFSMYKEPKNAALRAFRYSLIQLKQYNRASKEKNVDILSTASTPPTQGLLFSNLKKKLSKKYGHTVPFVYELQDVFPDSLVLAGMTRKGSLLWKLGRKVEDYTYRHADVIVVISEDIKKNIMEKGVPEEKIVLIRNWIDIHAVHPIAREDNTLWRELSLRDGIFYVVYAGNLGRAQAIDTILDTAKITIDNAEVEYLIFGQGVCEAKVKERVREEGLTNVKIFPFQPQSRVSEVYSLGDLCLLTCKKGAGKGAFPSKTATILATATSVLVSFDKDSELCSFIEQNDCGYCVEPEAPEALAETILALQKNNYELKQKGLNGRVCAEKYFSKEECTRKYVELYQSILQKPASED